MAGLMGGIGAGLSNFERAYSTAQARQDQLAQQRQQQAMMQAQIDNNMKQQALAQQGQAATNALIAGAGQGGMMGRQAPPIGIASPQALAGSGKQFTAQQAYGMPEAQQQALFGQSLAGADMAKVLAAQQSMQPKQVKPDIVEMGGSQGYGQYLVNPLTGQSSFLGGSKGDEQPFVAIEDAAGNQGWIRKGEAIPEGSKISRGSGVSVNIGNDKDAQREAYAKQISNKYAGNSLYALNDMKTLSDESKLPVFGMQGLAASQIPGTNAFAIAQGINTVQSSISFNRLNEMRQSSKTGGALGAVSEPELKMLRDSVASLNQGLSENQFWKNWERVRMNFDQVVNGPAGVVDEDQNVADPLGLRR